MPHSYGKLKLMNIDLAVRHFLQSLGLLVLTNDIIDRQSEKQVVLVLHLQAGPLKKKGMIKVHYWFLYSMILPQ